MIKQNIILSIILMMFAIILGGCSSFRVSKQGETQIVCIGVEYSRVYGSCSGAVLDSKNMSSLLSKYGNVKTLQNQNATRANVKKYISNAVKSELAIIFYSGHGGSQRFSDTGVDEVDGKDEFLCLYDGMLRDNEIWDIISTSKGRVFLIFDCCHSETMFRSAGMSMSMLSDMVLPLDNNINMLCWSGCADNTYSYGSIKGGELTNAIRKHYKDGMSYYELWNKVRLDSNLQKSQIVKKTQIGVGFETECFR